MILQVCHKAACNPLVDTDRTTSLQLQRRGGQGKRCSLGTSNQCRCNRDTLSMMVYLTATIDPQRCVPSLLPERRSETILTKHFCRLEAGLGTSPALVAHWRQTAWADHQRQSVRLSIVGELSACQQLHRGWLAFMICSIACIQYVLGITIFAHQ